MRSSKSRSRGKSNRSRSPSNNINRVFDSSGPEGKVRGTPQQIIDKYTQLARDAFLGNDRVAGENFQQHAEHYTRLLAEAQRDADSKRQQSDQQNQQNQQRQQQRDQDRRNDADGNGNGGNGNGGNGGNEPSAKDAGKDSGNAGSGKPKSTRSKRAPKSDAQPGLDLDGSSDTSGSADVIDTSPDDGDSGLVETPESKPRKARAPRARKPKADAEGQPEGGNDPAPGTSEAAE